MSIIRAHPLEPVLRQSPLGGVSFPVDSRLISVVARPPFLTEGQASPRDSARCQELFARKDAWSRRAEQKRAGGQPAAGEPFIRLIDTPEEIVTWEADDLACLFYLGYAPPRIPTGTAAGHVYQVLGNPLINDVSQALWGGKVIMKMRCDDGHEMFASVNHAFRAPAAWAELYIATNPKKETMGFYADEWLDGDASMLIDYSADFDALCPVATPRFYDAAPAYNSRDRWAAAAAPNPLVANFLNAANAIGFPSLVGLPGSILSQQRVNFAMFDNSWPIRDVLDATRWIGRDEAQKLDIYLGRSFFSFPEGLRTVCWFHLAMRDLIEVPLTT